MYFFREIIDAFENSIELCFIAPIAMGILVWATALAYVCKNKEVLYAFAFMIVGGVSLAMFAVDMHLEAKIVCWSLLAFAYGLCYIVLLLSFAIYARIEQRKKNRAQILRKLQFALPDKDNSYVRARLNTALKDEKNIPAQENNEKNEILRLEHARKLLAKIKEAPLTKAERMEAEEMSRMFTSYLRKSKWTANDVRMMNELFSALLKIAAKYAV